jgi:hypothetical protein
MATRTPPRDEALGRHVGHPDRELGLVIVERLVGAEPADAATARALDDVLVADTAHAARVLATVVSLGSDDTPADAPLRSALADELALVRRRVLAGRVARHGSLALGPVAAARGAPGPHVALALEALAVTLDPTEASRVLPLATPELTPETRLERLAGTRAGSSATAPASSDLAGRLRDIVEDPGDAWRSAWLTACALYAARTRGLMADIDTRRARALGDPAIDEQVAAVEQPWPSVSSPSP